MFNEKSKEVVRNLQFLTTNIPLIDIKSKNSFKSLITVSIINLGEVEKEVFKGLLYLYSSIKTVRIHTAKFEDFEEVLEVLKDLPNLNTLFLKGIKSKNWKFSFNSFPNLKILSIRECGHISMKGFENIMKN